MAQIKTYNEIANPTGTGAIGLVQVQPAGSTLTDGVIALSNVDSIGIQLVGTFTATVQFEASNNGTTWVACKGEAAANNTAVTTATAAGLFRVQRDDLSAYKFFRLNVSAFTSVTSFDLTLTTRKE
jgi:hypothetical protein